MKSLLGKRMDFKMSLQPNYSKLKTVGTGQCMMYYTLISFAPLLVVS